MKLKGVFALLSLSVMVKGTWWSAAVQPIILSLGAIMGAIDLDVLEIPFINKYATSEDEDVNKKTSFKNFFTPLNKRSPVVGYYNNATLCYCPYSTPC